MLKKILITTTFLISTHSFALTCPTITEIKNGQLSAWRPVDINSGAPVSDLSKFKKRVKYFALAEWMQDAPEGESHCYYFDKNRSKDYLNIFLARNHVLPIEGSPHWRWLGSFTMQCEAGIEACEFVFE